jgi:hypothetical protein
MMHEAFRRRLEVLEKTRRLQSLAMESRHIVFWDGITELDSDLADGPGGFICNRRMGESLAGFQDRADAECLAANPHPRAPPILVFHPN